MASFTNQVRLSYASETKDLKDLTILQQLRFILLMLLVHCESFTAALSFLQTGIMLTGQPCQRLVELFAVVQWCNSPLKPLFKSGVSHLCSHCTGQEIYHQSQKDEKVTSVSGRHQHHMAKLDVSERGKG